jgi:sugar-specific transcriptional regulator TrmB
MELSTALTAIGFTEYEAKVYLALLRESPATGYQISKVSGVPRSMVYETLSRLHNQGVVLETVEGRATLYRPLRPDVLLDHYKADHLRLLSGLRSDMLALYEAPAEEHTWTITGQDSVYAYASQMIREATQELYLVLDDEALSELRNDLADARQRGIEVRALLTGKSASEVLSRVDTVLSQDGGKAATGEIARHPPLESELQGLTGMLLVVADDAETLIAGEGKRSATTTRSTNLVVITRQFVWMELFTQRIYARLGPDLLERLSPEDRQIFESLEEDEA